MDKEFGIHDTGASDQWPDSNSASPTARVKRLRQESLDAVPSLSTERAVLMTEFYHQEHGMVSTPVKRALAFRYLMENGSYYQSAFFQHAIAQTAVGHATLATGGNAPSLGCAPDGSESRRASQSPAASAGVRRSGSATAIPS